MSDPPGGQLRRTLGPLMLWGLGVGYVISGMYFGWNLGLPLGGSYGLLAATLIVTVLYVAFVLSYAELACAMPKAGGAFVYAHEGLGPVLGFLAGMGQWMEFVFAPPAIAAAIGAYFQIFFPGVPPLVFALSAYALFTAINIYGVKASAALELGVTVLAVAELLIFTGLVGPRFSWSAFSQDALPRGWGGILPAIPFAIWFYVCIEGVANVAEETREPQKDLLRGFGWAMGTLVVLALLTLFGAVGVDGWRAVVFKPGVEGPSDSPLPLALGKVVGEGHAFYHLLIMIGLLGLVASFHGILLAAGRATFEFGRIGYLPRRIGTASARGTPAAALIANMGVGIVALLTGKTGEIITIAVLGALLMYVVSMAALFRLRRTRPDLERPFRVPFYPWTPAVALALSALSLAAMAWYNRKVFLIFLGLLSVAHVCFYGFLTWQARRKEA